MFIFRTRMMLEGSSMKITLGSGKMFIACLVGDFGHILCVVGEGCKIMKEHERA